MMIDILEVNGSKICRWVDPGVYTGEYYNYCVSLFVRALEYVEESVNIILGDMDFKFTNSNKTFRFDIQSEHTLVKIGGRSVDRIVYGNTDLLGEDGKYLIRIPNFEYYAGLDGTIEYSLPNIENIKTNPEFADYLDTAAYIAPVIYDGISDFKVKPRMSTISMFSSNPSDRRSEFINRTKARNIINIEGVFPKYKLREVYRNSRIMVNVHQTDHHHTFEELRVLPALCHGVIIVSEKVPLKETIPYADSIVWSSYEDLDSIIRDVQDNYEWYYEQIFTGELELTIKQLHKDNITQALGLIK